MEHPLIGGGSPKDYHPVWAQAGGGNSVSEEAFTFTVRAFSRGLCPKQLSLAATESESESEKALLPSTILHIRGICCGDVHRKPVEVTKEGGQMGEFGKIVNKAFWIRCSCLVAEDGSPAKREL